MSVTLLLLLRPTPFCVPRLVPHQAKSSGKFSSEELLNLKREFQHHKDKIHEYNILMDTVSRTEGELRESLCFAAEQRCCKLWLSLRACPSLISTTTLQAASKLNSCRQIHLLTLFHSCLAVTNFAVAQVTHPESQSEVLSVCSVWSSCT